MKYLLLIPFIILLALWLGNNRTNRTEESLQQPPPASRERIYIRVDQDASFQGGTLNDFRSWVQEKINDKDDSESSNLARITVQFTVNSEGDVVNAVIVRGTSGEMDDLVKQAILSSPRWQPAKSNGENVAQLFVIRILVTVPEDNKHILRV